MKDKVKLIHLCILTLLFGSGWLMSSSSPDPGQEHIKVELTCQAAQRDRCTGEIINASNPVYKDYFCPKEEVWVAVNPKTCGRDYEYKDARLYVVNHQSAAQWQDNTRLKDVSTDGYEMVTIQPGCANNNYTRVWESPNVREEGYDVVVDFEPLGIYNKGQDILECGDHRGGFYVPEKWVCLESISLNHTLMANCCDAINIRKNIKEEIRIPEWKRGEESHPAVYIKDRSFTVKPVFSASGGVGNAEIKAYTKAGYLGDLKEMSVLFADGSSALYPSYFKAIIDTPNKIQSFYQQWVWTLQRVNGQELSGEEVHIATSINKIYILLNLPQCPWTLGGKTEPWTDVLDYSCRWACGEPTPEGAATKITKYLYEKTGAEYEQSAERYSESGNPYSKFKLTEFLEEMPEVGGVNCYDMGKALATFANVLGCCLDFRYSNPFQSSLNCIKPIGKDWNCNEKFDNHAFGSIGDRVFETTFKVDTWGNRDKQPYRETWMINIPWCYYKGIVVKEGSPAYPQMIIFQIEGP